MYTITGVTGKVGAATARELISRGAPVRAVLRDPAKRAYWERGGAEIALADFADRATLADAFRGSDGVFVMLPIIPTLDDGAHRRLADAIAGAIDDSGVGQVVLLSSVGADLPEGTGPIRWLYHLEARLSETTAVVSAIRPCHFQEKVETVLDAVLGEGIYPVFAESADIPMPMIATRDIGVVAADALLSPPQTTEVIDLQGPLYTESSIADRLSVILERPIQVMTIPRLGWLDALLDAGLIAPYACEIAALSAAEQDGLLEPRGDRLHQCTTPIEETLRHLVETIADLNPSV